MPGGAPKGNHNHFKHGLSHTRIDNIYKSMIARCYNPNNPKYKNYGGRGIKICEEWRKDKKIFFEWAINSGYSQELSIDRKNVNGDYTPNNCRWATYKQQANNKTNTRWYEHNGENHTLSEWSEITGIPYGTLSRRINRDKWSIERALSERREIKP